MSSSPRGSKFKRNAIKDNPSSYDPPKEREPDTLMIGTSSLPLVFSTNPIALLERLESKDLGKC